MSGKHFDPVLIDIFFKHIDKFLNIYNTSMEQISKEEKSFKNMTPTQKILDCLLKER